MKSKTKLPRGWTEEKILAVIDHYENQTDDEAVAEDEAAFAACTMIAVPNEMVPAVQALLERLPEFAKRNGTIVKKPPTKRRSAR